MIDDPPTDQEIERAADLLGMDPLDVEDLIADQPPAADWIKDLSHGHDVLDMIEDYCVDPELIIEQYGVTQEDMARIMDGWPPHTARAQLGDGGDLEDLLDDFDDEDEEDEDGEY